MSDALDLSRLSFSAFAGRCEQEAEKWDAWAKSDTYDGEGLEAASYEAAVFAKQAARHARLLERIEELVSQVEGLEMNDDAYSRGFKKAHTAVLRLLREEK